MQHKRLAITLLGAILTGFAFAPLLHLRLPVVDSVTELKPSQFYALNVESDHCEFDLTFQNGTSYVLIVSSLGDAGQSYCINLKADTIAELKPLSARWLDDFRPRRTYSRLLSVAPRNERGDFADRIAVSSQSEKSSARQVVRDFDLHVTDGNLDDAKQYVRVSSRLIAEGVNVRIYLDYQQAVSELAQDLVGEIVCLMDRDIVPKLRRELGSCRDVDGDKKFSVLLTPWLGHLQGGQTSLEGFVRPTDFRTDVAPPFSNRCDMLYLNANLKPGPHLRDLLAHEFTHAVCFSERLARKPQLPNEEDWLNEAIAHLLEYGLTNLDYRISRFLSAPGEFPLVVSDYYRAGLWRDHGCRGATFLFLQWCVDQYGVGILRQLVRNPARGTENVEMATGEKFDELFRRWSIALWNSGTRRPEPQSLTNSLEFSNTALPDNQKPNIWRDASGCFTSIDIRGRLSEWGLAGPRCDVWDVNAGKHSVRLKGTASTFLELRDSLQTSARRIHVLVQSGTNVQLSIVKLPHQYPRMHIETEWVEVHDPSLGGHEITKDFLRIQVIEDRCQAQVPNRVLHSRASRAEPRFEVEMIVCERNHQQIKQSYCLIGDRLKQHQVLRNESDSHSGFRVGGNSTHIVGIYQLPISRPDGSLNGLTVKVVATDVKGRRVVAWANLDEREPPRPRDTMVASRHSSRLQCLSHR